MKSKRYTFFYAVFAFAAILISARLVNLQIANGNYYREKSNSRTVRSVELIAPRGEILDRNGRAIVSNRTGYNVYILGNHERDQKELNKLIFNLGKTVKSKNDYGEENFPIELKNGKYVFSQNNAQTKKWKKENGFEKSSTAENVMKELRKKYDAEKYGKSAALKICAIRFDMTKRGFSMASPYLFNEDTPIEEIGVIKENSELFSDVSIITQPVRNYPYTTLCAHILGRVGVISAEEYEQQAKSGENIYNINSRIGKDGIEKYLEETLRGINGSGSIEQTSNGYSVGEKVDKKPVSGKNVNLTIDLDVQQAAEEALSETVKEISAASDRAEGGRDADSGSIVVLDVNSGDVLAMASYPSYDIESFGKNYNDLLQNPSKPLFNRSLAGTYSPASTFKPLVGLAALEEGVITPEETIYDSGKYTYFKDYQPACWIYNQKGATHGYLNVSEAIRDSCNVFFYETGRRLTIEKINEYAKLFGFGEKSGICLADEEKSGMVASPENRKKSGGIWYPGDTCQTAIGQSDTLVTPLQLANYIAAIANGGTRYTPHLIRSIEGEMSETKSEVKAKTELKEETINAVTDGMRRVVTEGTAQSAFSGCKVKVAAKTGSAQTSSIYTNGVCVAYAPYDNPQIAIACVIEKAGSGAHVAKAVRRVVDSYFDNAEDDNLKTNVLIK